MQRGGQGPFAWDITVIIQSNSLVGDLSGRCSPQSLLVNWMQDLGEEVEVERSPKFWLSEPMAESTVCRDGRAGAESQENSGYHETSLWRCQESTGSGTRRELNNPHAQPPLSVSPTWTSCLASAFVPFGLAGPESLV